MARPAAVELVRAMVAECKCLVKGCRSKGRTFSTRSALRSHLRMKHRGHFRIFTQLHATATAAPPRTATRCDQSTQTCMGSDGLNEPGEHSLLTDVATSIRTCNEEPINSGESDGRAAGHQPQSSLRRPRERTHEGATRDSSGPLRIQPDDGVLKRVRRLDRRLGKWRSYDDTERERVLTNMEMKLSGILDTAKVDTKQLRTILFNAAAAIAAPLATPPARDEPRSFSDDGTNRLRREAELQKRLRKVLLRALRAWSQRCNLEDVQIQPILDRLGKLIQRFESSHGDVQCAGSRWTSLKVLLGPDQTMLSTPTNGLDNISKDTTKSLQLFR